MVKTTKTESVLESEIVVSTPVASPAKTAFLALIEAYKKQSPVKYALKKTALEAKLNTL